MTAVNVYLYTSSTSEQIMPDTKTQLQVRLDAIVARAKDAASERKKANARIYRSIRIFESEMQSLHSFDKTASEGCISEELNRVLKRADHLCDLVEYLNKIDLSCVKNAHVVYQTLVSVSRIRSSA